MTIISGNIFVAADGDQWEWTITVTNDSAVSATSVLVTNVVSADADYVSNTITQGSFNTMTLDWTVGTMAPGATAVLKLKMEVADIASAPFTIESEVSSFGTEATPLNNITTSEVQNLCAAFSDCFVNQSVYTTSIPEELDFEAAILALAPDPSCGDIIIFGGGCEDTYFTMYSCVALLWSTPVKIGATTNLGNILYVSTQPSLGGLKGSLICTFENIQDAVDAATSGDTIVVLPGEHSITGSVDLDGKTNLTFDINPGAFVIGETALPVFTDSATYIGYLRFTGGGTIQGQNEDGIIVIENTDPTSTLDIDNLSIVNEAGSGISTSVPTRLNSVGIYDVSVLYKSVISPVVVQVRNVFSNTIEDTVVPVILENIAVDPAFTLHYV